MTTSTQQLLEAARLSRSLYPWMTRRECLQDAKTKNAVAVFYPQ